MGIFGRAVVGCTSNTHLQLWYLSPSLLSAKPCPMSVHRSVQELEFYRIFSSPFPMLASHFEGHKSLSVECTPPALVSISSTLSAKLFPMSVHRSVQELEFYSLVSRLKPISYTYLGGPYSAVRRTHTPNIGVYQLLSITSVCKATSNECPSIRSRVKIFYSLVSRLKPITYTMDIFRRAVVGRPSNAHLQLWCLSAPLHLLCLLNFIP